MLERDIKLAVGKVLRGYAPEVIYEMHVPGGFGKSGLDFNVCAWGEAIYIETKAPGKWLTARQRFFALNALGAGGRVFIISGDEGIKALADYLHRRKLEQ